MTIHSDQLNNHRLVHLYSFKRIKRGIEKKAIQLIVDMVINVLDEMGNQVNFPV